MAINIPRRIAGRNNTFLSSFISGDVESSYA
jgi:hypothetical protein